MKIGLLGGSFDPVHLAHIALAQIAADTLELDQVQLIPAANPWQRPALAASPAHRQAMLDIATRNFPFMQVNPLELHRGGKTYTIDTLRELPAGPEYHWILGADQLGNFCSWHHWQDIACLARLAVARRPGSTLSVPQALADWLATQQRPLEYLPVEPMDISSTLIRERLAQGLPTQGLLDVAVMQYIQENRLYLHPSV